jgi:hypothetical protein
MATTATRTERTKQRARDRKPPAPKLAALKTEIENLLAGTPDAFIECRDIGHSWTKVGTFVKGAHYVRLLRCQRCGTERRQALDRRGAYHGNSYEYAEGYQFEGTGGIARAEVRRHVLAHVPVFGSEDEMLAQLMRGSARKASSNGNGKSSSNGHGKARRSGRSAA